MRGYGTVGYSWTRADDLKLAGLHFDVPTKDPFVGGGVEVICFGSVRCAIEYRATFNGYERVNLVARASRLRQFRSGCSRRNE